MNLEANTVCSGRSTTGWEPLKARDGVAHHRPVAVGRCCTSSLQVLLLACLPACSAHPSPLQVVGLSRAALSASAPASRQRLVCRYSGLDEHSKLWTPQAVWAQPDPRLSTCWSRCNAPGSWYALHTPWPRAGWCLADPSVQRSCLRLANAAVGTLCMRRWQGRRPWRQSAIGA